MTEFNQERETERQVDLLLHEQRKVFESLQDAEDSPAATLVSSDASEHDSITEPERESPSTRLASAAAIDVALAQAGRAPMLAIDGRRLTSPLREEKATPAVRTSELAEGGAIEVAAAVAHTQYAHEARMFAHVAAVLDERGSVVQAAPSEPKPLASELARPVDFELAGLERAGLAEQFGASAVPATESRGALLAEAPLSDADADAVDDPARAWAFAEWPLLVIAGVGAGFVAQRYNSRIGRQNTLPRLQSG